MCIHFVDKILKAAIVFYDVHVCHHNDVNVCMVEFDKNV